jgi:hypothetical protein
LTFIVWVVVRVGARAAKRTLEVPGPREFRDQTFECSLGRRHVEGRRCRNWLLPSAVVALRGVSPKLFAAFDQRLHEGESAFGPRPFGVGVGDTEWVRRQLLLEVLPSEVSVEGLRHQPLKAAYRRVADVGIPQRLGFLHEQPCRPVQLEFAQQDGHVAP